MIGGFRKCRTAVRDHIAGESYSLVPSEVTERNSVIVKAESSADLRVFVTPASTRIATASRARLVHAWRMDIHVLQLVTDTDEALTLATQDALMDFVDEIESGLIGAQTLSIDGSNYVVRVPLDTDRVSMDEESMLRYKMFWARVQVEVVT